MPQVNTQAGRKEWIALGVLVLPLLLVSMDITVLYFAVPDIAASLQPSGAQQLWMIDIYGFILAGALLTMGNVGDLIGRRLLLMIGSALFGVASITAAFATGPEMLIVARAVQGLGGATLLPSTLALIRNMFHDEKQRSTAIAVWSIGTAAGAALGPLFGGLMLNAFWWGSIFLINVPVMVLLLVLSPFMIPEFRLPKGEAGKFDLISALLSMASVLPIIWGLKEFAAHGFNVLYIVVPVLGVLMGVLFVFRQTRLKNPMIDLSLFKNKGFGPALLLTLTAFFCLVGFGVFTTQYLMEIKEMTPLVAGLWTLASPVLTMVFSPMAAINVHKTRPAYLLTLAFVVATSGFVGMALIKVDSSILHVVASAVGIGVGSGVVLTLITDMVVGTAPPERAGAVSAMTQTGQELGGALGIASFGAIGTAIYSRSVDANFPDSAPPEALAGAKETVGAAIGIAEKLPGPAGQEVLGVAKAAFTNSMHTAAFLGVMVGILAALLAIFRLRHLKPEPDAPVPDDTPTVMFAAIKAHGVRQYGYPPAADTVTYPPVYQPYQYPPPQPRPLPADARGRPPLKGLPPGPPQGQPPGPPQGQPPGPPPGQRSVRPPGPAPEPPPFRPAGPPARPPAGHPPPPPPAYGRGWDGPPTGGEPVPGPPRHARPAQGSPGGDTPSPEQGSQDRNGAR